MSTHVAGVAKERSVEALVPVIAAAVVAAVLAAVPARAQVEIDHPGVDCFVAGSFPRIDARLSPPAEVARAELYFRAAGTADWYRVEMRDTGAGLFEGVLPSPLRSTRGIEYYVSALDRRSSASRSEDRMARVVANAGECSGVVAPVLGSAPASLVVSAATGSPAVPAGFGSIGLVGAAGGVPLSLVIGGAAAAAGGAVVVARSGGDDEGRDEGPAERPTPTPAPRPEPTPEPARDVSGRWVGSFVEDPSAVQCSVSTGLEVTLQQESPAAARGSFELTIRSATPAPQDPCPVAPGDVFTGPAGLSLAGADVELRLAIPGGGPEVVLLGSLAGDTMGGTSPPDAGGPGGTWELTRQ